MSDAAKLALPLDVEDLRYYHDDFPQLAAKEAREFAASFFWHLLQYDRVLFLSGGIVEAPCKKGKFVEAVLSEDVNCGLILP